MVLNASQLGYKIIVTRPKKGWFTTEIGSVGSFILVTILVISQPGVKDGQGIYRAICIAYKICDVYIHNYYHNIYIYSI